MARRRAARARRPRLSAANRQRYAGAQRESGVCARLLAPRGTRVHATPATNGSTLRAVSGSNRPSGRDGRGGAGEAAASKRKSRAPAASRPQGSGPRSTTAPRGRAERGSRARLARVPSSPTARAPTRPRRRARLTRVVVRPEIDDGAARARRRARLTRVVVRPEIDDGAARARRTRDPDAPARGSSLNPTARAPARFARLGATGTARPAKALARREDEIRSRHAPWPGARSTTAPALARNADRRARARLLTPAGARARALRGERLESRSGSGASGRRGI